MKCKDCKCCHKGFFESTPEAYVCTGVKEPFVIDDINHECTEYHKTNCITLPLRREVYVQQFPYVNDIGIYIPCEEYVQEGFRSNYKLLISKEMFVEAYNKWIKGEKNEQPN